MLEIFPTNTKSNNIPGEVVILGIIISLEKLAEVWQSG